MDNTEPMFTLHRDSSGQWVYESSDGQRFQDVQVVRAFPISDPSNGISIVSADGHEVRWIDALEALPSQALQQVSDALASREFMPEIMRINAVSKFATPSVWQVHTDRGETSFTLKGEEDIRRLAGLTLLINDSHGIHYLIRDVSALDKHSRRLLDHFL